MKEKLPPKIDAEGAIVRYLVYGRTTSEVDRKGKVSHHRRVAAFVYDGDQGIEKFIPISGKIPEDVQIFTIDQIREVFGEGHKRDAQKALRGAERRRLKIKKLRSLPGRRTP